VHLWLESISPISRVIFAWIFSSRLSCQTDLRVARTYLECWFLYALSFDFSAPIFGLLGGFLKPRILCIGDTCFLRRHPATRLRLEEREIP
jgi:hypothetical protein